jgi:hypothetical protein
MKSNKTPSIESKRVLTGLRGLVRQKTFFRRGIPPRPGGFPLAQFFRPPERAEI